MKPWVFQKFDLFFISDYSNWGALEDQLIHRVEIEMIARINSFRFASRIALLWLMSDETTNSPDRVDTTAAHDSTTDDPHGILRTFDWLMCCELWFLN